MSSFKIIFLICLVVLTGCLSSILKEPAPTFTNELMLPALPTDFVTQTNSAFPSWKNKNTSNVISVLSECTDQVTNLKTAHAMITNAIENETVLEEKKVMFNSENKNTAAYFRKVSGTVDSHPIEIHSTSFKYKNCFYLTSLSGHHEKINSDLNNWNEFNQHIEFKK